MLVSFRAETHTNPQNFDYNAVSVQLDAFNGNTTPNKENTMTSPVDNRSDELRERSDQKYGQLLRRLDKSYDIISNSISTDDNGNCVLHKYDLTERELLNLALKARINLDHILDTMDERFGRESTKDFS